MMTMVFGFTRLHCQSCNENNLDREEQDFSLEVASAVSSPLKHIRQYKKKCR
jgi:hypothetical protein